MKLSCEFEISTYNTLCSRCPTKLISVSKKNACGGHLVFQNEAINIPRQDFIVMNISSKFEKSTYNTLASRGVMRKSLHTVATVAYSCIIHSIHRIALKIQKICRNYTYCDRRFGIYPVKTMLYIVICIKTIHFILTL